MRGPYTLFECTGRIEMWERSVRDWLVEKFAERPPAVLDGPEQKPVPWGRAGNGTIMLLVEQVTVGREVALEQNLPCFSKSRQGKAVFHEQGLVEDFEKDGRSGREIVIEALRRPGRMGQHEPRSRPLTGHALVPCTQVPGRQDDLCFRVSLHQLRAKTDGRHVRDCLKQSQPEQSKNLDGSRVEGKKHTWQCPRSWSNSFREYFLPLP